MTWDGKLLDGNRRKFAVMWALSDRGGADIGQRRLLERVPMRVLPPDATESQEKFILIQENYADSLKEPWPEVVTNGALYDRYQELSDQFPSEDDLSIRRRLRDEFPRFPVTDIRNRIETWQLILEFRGEYNDELDEDDLARLINDQFQYFGKLSILLGAAPSSMTRNFGISCSKESITDCFHASHRSEVLRTYSALPAQPRFSIRVRV